MGGERGKSHSGPGHLLSYLFLILEKPFQNFALGKSAMKDMLLVEGPGSCGASPFPRKVLHFFLCAQGGTSNTPAAAPQPPALQLLGKNLITPTSQ